MLRENRLYINWHFLLLGLFVIIIRCDARAVNVSNTWTMPQEGLNVFYRFFRDRISWFEADAVCQFHHANLVTVDNSFQFDATRDLLRELDVNDIVWIGLMRPQSSDRFMWSSNSRPLVADTGYWAESLPLMDAPLCAVIDPIRDYRWHALRCGGPETASFLCEMPVPSWADACNLKDMPNLTLQYMADTASIELIRNCQEEGLLRTMCRGKQDRERALQDLICPRERLEAQRINDITNSHFKSLQIINSIPTDNNENNNIELLPMEVNYGPHYPEEVQTEKNTVQRLIEQFNVDELMQADEPSNMDTVSSFYKIPGLIPKPVKKSAKKVLDYPKKNNGKEKSTDLNAELTQKKDKKGVRTEMEDMMMGDQPEMPDQFLKEEVSNEILEPLPHIKKTNMHREDGLDKVEQEATALKKIIQKSKEIENKKAFTISSTTTTTITTPITTEPATASTTTISSPSTFSTKMLLTTTLRAEEMPQFREIHIHKHNSEAHKEQENSWDHLTTTMSSVTIGHPIHPQQPHSNVLNEENQHSHTKESADSSHFIPPMLMVKSHYIPSTGKHGHPEHDHHHHHQQEQHQQPHQQQLQRADEPPHSEITTEEQASTLLKQSHNRDPAETKIMVTTPKVLDLQKTTLKILDTSISKFENEAQPAEHQIALTTAEKGSSIKPITEQYTTETEQSNVSKNLHSEESHNKMTTTTLQSAAATTAKTIANAEMLSLLATDFKEINKNDAGHERNKNEKQELKSPQTTYTDAETTQTTTTAEYVKEAKNLEPATDNAAKIKNTADITNLEATIEIKQQQTPRMEGKLTAIKNEDSKEDLETTTGTTEKLVPTQTSAVITISTTLSAPITQQTSATTKTETQSLQQIEKEQTSQEELEEEMAKDQDKKETTVETTEIPVTSSAITKAQEQEENIPAIVTTNTTTTYSTPTKRTNIAATTTVKPITTTMPQNEIKSTETSFSFASTATTATTNKPAAEYISSITTIKPPTTTTIMPYTNEIRTTTATTEAEAKAATATTTAKAETERETSTQTSPPETTRNFLKVTTEIPFKPNRRRSLTKPETVSYMKKILG